MSDTAKVETIENWFVTMVSLGSHCGFWQIIHTGVIVHLEI